MGDFDIYAAKMNDKDKEVSIIPDEVKFDKPLTTLPVDLSSIQAPGHKGSRQVWTSEQIFIVGSKEDSQETINLNENIERHDFIVGFFFSYLIVKNY